MFLTRMALNPRRRGTGRLLASPHAMHAAVLAGFPPGAAEPTEDGRVLWRLDVEGPHLWLYVASPEPPDLAHLTEQAGWATGAWETRDYDPFLARIRTGRAFAFRLTANPVHAVPLPDGREKRYGHVTAAQQQSWLLERAERHGFRVLADESGEPQLVVSDRRKRTFRRGESTVTLSTARFDGALEVRDADALRTVLTHGLGRAKGYGCGLLTLVPL